MKAVDYCQRAKTLSRLALILEIHRCCLLGMDSPISPADFGNLQSRLWAL